MRSRLLIVATCAALITAPAISQDVRNTYIAVAAQVADNTITLAKLNGLGTSVATALGINVGTSGAVLVKGTSVCADLSNGATGCSTAYTTGTCTPTFAGASTAGTGQTYAANGQVCFYEQIGGRLVTVRLWVNASSMGTASGNLLIKGLPITADATTNNFGGCISTFYSATGLTASNFGVTGLIRPSTTQVEIYAGSSTTSNAVTVAQAGASAIFAMTCNYQS